MMAEAVTGEVFIVSSIPVFWMPVPVGSFLRFHLWYVTLAIFLVHAARLGSARRFPSVLFID
jgi:hypothetical protein